MQIMERIANLIRPPTYPRFYKERGRHYAEYSDGTVYQVRQDGSYKRVTLRRHHKRRVDKDIQGL